MVDDERTDDVHVEVTAAWSALTEPWRAVFELAWDAFRAGSVPVGAVVVNPAGDIVTRGRSRSYESSAPPQQVAGTYLAHAEVNALLPLPRGDYRDHVLYSTLEPCLLCTAALTHAHLGTVRFAAPDPLWTGLDVLPQLNAHVQRRWTRRERCLDGPWATWAALLPLVFYLRRGSTNVEQAYRPRSPALVALAHDLLGPGEPQWGGDSLLHPTLERLWERLLAAGEPPGARPSAHAGERKSIP
jgi:tRNA(Arg) A34 adenosine deaminase TadA